MASQAIQVPGSVYNDNTELRTGDWSIPTADRVAIDSTFRNSVASALSDVRILGEDDRTATLSTRMSIARTGATGNPRFTSSFLSSGFVRLTVGSARAIFTVRFSTSGTSAASYRLTPLVAADRNAVFAAARALGTGNAPLTVELSDEAFPTGLAGFHVAGTAVTKAYIGSSEIMKAYVGSSELG